VMLRQPRGNNDQRADPFWEFGSFGCTHCHRNNLLHPKHCQITDGDRLAFVQGGRRGLRLMLLTPPIKRLGYVGGNPTGCVELRWDSTQKPFSYERAPSLFETPSPGIPGLFPRLYDSLSHTDRSTIDAKFASRFRARSRPLESELASELDAGFNIILKSANESDFITHYEEALPWCGCHSTPSDRRRDYRQLLQVLTNSTNGETGGTGCSK
jgi:hypothetical protein